MPLLLSQGEFDVLRWNVCGMCTACTACATVQLALLNSFALWQHRNSSFDLLRCWYVCLSLSVLQVLPDVRHAWLVQELTHEVTAQAYTAGIAQLCPRANAVDASTVAAAREAGFSVRAWGVKSPEVRSAGTHHLCANGCNPSPAQQFAAGGYVD